MLAFQVMPERRRVVVRVEGEVQGAEFLSAMKALLERDPARLRDDFLFDMTRYEGGVTHDDLKEFALWLDARFGTVERGGATTCLVSGDTGYRFWAPAMELLFGKRRFRWAPDMAAAEAELASARTGCPMEDLAPPRA